MQPYLLLKLLASGLTYEDAFLDAASVAKSMCRLPRLSSRLLVRSYDEAVLERPGGYMASST